MRPLPEPAPVSEPKPALPTGTWLSRATRAILVEKRLPTNAARTRDRLALKLGRPYQTLVVNDPEGGFKPARLRVRRQSADRFFIAEVFTEHAYSPPGYEICESDTIIDVGANIGSFTIFAARRARQGRVIAIEPAQDSFSLLEHNIGRNRLGNVSARRAAVTGAAGPVTLHLSIVGTGHHSLDASLTGSSLYCENVPGLALADLFETHRVETCNFLKLDCEGAEFPILESLPPILAPRIERLALEYHTQPTSPKRPQADALAQRLLDLGFTIDIYTDVLNTNRGMLFARR